MSGVGSQTNPLIHILSQTEEGNGGGLTDELRVGDEENIELEDYHQDNEDEEEDVSSSDEC